MFPLTKQERAVLAALLGIIMAGSIGQIIFKLFPAVGCQTDFIERWQPEQKTEINRASVDELVKIPYIGPARAQAIIHYRDENGLFGDMGQIKDVHGIGPKLYEQIKPFIEVKGP